MKAKIKQISNHNGIFLCLVKSALTNKHQLSGHKSCFHTLSPSSPFSIVTSLSSLSCLKWPMTRYTQAKTGRRFQNQIQTLNQINLSLKQLLTGTCQRSFTQSILRIRRSSYSLHSDTEPTNYWKDSKCSVTILFPIITPPSHNFVQPSLPSKLSSAKHLTPKVGNKKSASMRKVGRRSYHLSPNQIAAQRLSSEISLAIFWPPEDDVAAAQPAVY